MRLFNIFLVIVSLIVLFSCKPELSDSVASEYEKLPQKIDFNQHVKPILSDNCFACHGPDEGSLKAGLKLNKAEYAFAELPESPGKYAIVPGNLKDSELFKRIISTDPDYLMPTPESHLQLSDTEKAVLIKWIEQGAEYKDHWAFLKPKKVQPPEVNNTELIVNPIDNFIQAHLEAESLEPNPEADKETLLRRLSFDLTGLPPTLQEINSFLEDTSPGAYEKQVDRLLGSPHYGEQMALRWMDLARFADTHGYSVDRYRDMSPWRDWVIKAFNGNQAYDEFVTWQIAGDLIENPTREMKIATAFNRLHPQNMEGGINNEEFLVEYMVDRASTVGEAFMGLTVECARCHDHKYDPITQKNVYEMASYFNNIKEAGQISWNNAMPTPTLLITTEKEDEFLAYMDGLIKKTRSKIVEKESKAKLKFDTWLATKSYKNINRKITREGLVGHYSLEKNPIKNEVAPYQAATMKLENKEDQPAKFVEGKEGKGILLDGNTWLDLKKIGIFGRSQPFTVGLWANIPNSVTDGTIFHKGNGAILYAWRGFHLKIVNNKLEILMAHTAPGNTIEELTISNFPKDEWVHLAMTYDGSSKASGLKIFVNGKEQATNVLNDNLYKDILFRNENPEPALQFGARYRGKGIANGIIDEISVYDRELTTLEILQLTGNKEYLKLISKSIGSFSEEDKKILESYFVRRVAKPASDHYMKLAELRKKYVDSVEQVKEIMVMKETEPRQAYLLERGVYYARGDKVYPKTPEFLNPMPKGLPENRLGFAKWLFNEDHPLTSRVAINRIWQDFFGTGIVKSAGNFGNQGELPSHPQLLDYLATHFRESGWNMKDLCKMIVMSYTYRQDSKTTEKVRNKDPENRLLARGPSGRMTGEMLRDNVLAASGLLNKKIGGKSVKPYQPEGLWAINGAEYNQDEGDKLYRRSLYTFWKRSIPNPTLSTFDSPARNYCTMKRQETNTPLQALILLNDPTYIEAARVLGKKMVNANNVEKAVTTTFRKLTGRKPSAKELSLLIQLQQEEYVKFKNDPAKMKGWLNTGAFKIAATDDKALIAASAIVASTIINSDAAITKR